jgi:WD40 repeat protein
MSLETRAREAAEGLLAATVVATDDGLARLRRTHRRRGALRVAGAAVAVVCVVGVGALVVDGSDRTAPPVGPHKENVDTGAGDGIVSALERGHGIGQGAPAVSLPDPGSEPYPAWVAFDPDAERFLFTRWNIYDSPPNPVPSEMVEMAEEGRTLRVLAPGLDAPVATIHCEVQCNMMHSFGPGQDEVTTLTGGSDPNWRQPLIAEVWGYDGTQHAEIDLSAVAGNGRGIADLEWSPDGSRLAVSTYQGQVEPDCPGERPTSPGAPTEAEVYLLDRAGGDPRLVHQLSPRPQLDLRTPVLTELAWSPDSGRLGMISSTYCHYQQLDSPTLVSLDLESGTAMTLHRFDQTYDPYMTFTHGFAWSPDGTRLAVTSGAGIATIYADGQQISPTRGSGHGPLAWLDESGE